MVAMTLQDKCKDLSFLKYVENLKEATKVKPFVCWKIF